ncbi:MAG: DUF1822 family protein [Kovacikia sp.]
MTYRTYEIDGFALPLPIAQTTRDIATAFARKQPTLEKAEQVRLNTLAVSVVKDYLQMMGIPTDLDSSDSWNQIMRLCADVADLEVPGIGRLECRPVRSHAETCPIPPEVWEDRVGYVIVQIDDAFEEAKILGFVPTVAVEALPLAQLRSPEDLLAHLAQLRQAMAVQPSLAQPPARVRVNLSQWFEDVFEAGWETVESLFNQPELSPAFAFRGSDMTATPELEAGVRRVKLLEMGDAAPMFLITEIQTETEESRSDTPQTRIRLQVHPRNQPFLPQGLRLIVLDESGMIFLEAESRSVDNYIQLQFSGSPREAFSVQVRLGAVQVTQEFVV